MSNNVLFPFERNRYYAGKMLTSADFAAEQSYMNNKRRFLNNLLYGAGIVCGCNVYSLDDLSLFVESGCAIDPLGREIVIETSVVKKLSAIQGFEQVTGDKLTLCLRHVEENAHPVYSAKNQKSESEYEFNRIKEGYELFLIDSEMQMEEAELESEFMTQDVLYRDANYEISLSLPATVCKGKYVSMDLKVTKISDEEATLDYSAKLQMPSFLSMSGKHEQEISFEGLSLPLGATETKKIWALVQDVAGTESVLICKSDVANAETESFSMKVILSDIAPAALVDRELGKMSLELHDMGNTVDYIRLADISLIRTDSAYIIEHIEERYAKKYIETPATQVKRREFLSYFQEKELPGRVTAISADVATTPIAKIKETSENSNYASGTLEIPVGGKVKKGDVFYSGEIMHGLGAGNVYVEIGKEFIEDAAVEGANVKSTVYGNSELFAELEGKSPQIETAVRVLNDKGSFVLAVQFLTPADVLMLNFRWVAIRFSGAGIQAQDTTQGVQWIEAETPTAVVGTKDNYFFAVRFHNMDKCSVNYEVTEDGGGKITSDGVYTAPNKEGVYEIKISCIEHPFINTYAYAVVKKK